MTRVKEDWCSARYNVRDRVGKLQFAIILWLSFYLNVEDNISSSSSSSSLWIKTSTWNHYLLSLSLLLPLLLSLLLLVEQPPMIISSIMTVARFLIVDIQRLNNIYDCCVLHLS